ncbi:hypothetical protein E5N71_11945 [Candidatus Nitrosocosmicus sp. SS]|nr:hypothetical protein E5N71_11945 [Candidatus Nitrosocosmicus sp. SS]
MTHSNRMLYRILHTLILLELQDKSDKIQSLTLTFVKVLIESTGKELKVPVKFIDIYNEACRLRGGNRNKEESNLEIRQYVRDDLLKNGYIFVDPTDVDSIYLTQKTIDEYSDY